MIVHTPKELAVRGTFDAPITLTNGYVVSKILASGKGRDQIAILVQYTKGDEDHMELQIKWSNSPTFSHAFDSIYEQTDVDGYVLPVTETYKFTETGNKTLFKNSGGLYCRVGVKAVGGTPTGTCAILIRFDTVSKGG